MRILEVTKKRGLYLRRSPVISEDNIVGELPYKSRFYAVALRRIPPYTWAIDKDNFCIVAANGKNPYVQQLNGAPLPLG